MDWQHFGMVVIGIVAGAAITVALYLTLRKKP